MQATITFKIEIPDGITKEQVEEWVRFELGDHPSISMKNPLSKSDIEPFGDSLTIEFPNT